MNYNKCLLAILISFAFVSCSLNKMFLQPDKLPPGAKQLTIKTDRDTVQVKINPGNFQPSFYKGGEIVTNPDYTIESVVFESPDGNKLNGWLLKPPTKASITLLHFHGNAGFLFSQYQAMIPLIKYGYQIFVFDYSGFGFSEGEATRKNVLADGNAALTYIKGRDDVKDTKIVIYGQSLGGHLATVVAAERQDEIDGLVIEGAFSSHKDIAADQAWIFGRLLVKEQYSAKKAIAKYNKPVLIIHSKDDDIIPIRMAQVLFDHANAQKELYKIDGCHMCGTDNYAEQISDKIKAMVQ
jgi:pimeloyl-ACP methyl ester carboxylesterase